MATETAEGCCRSFRQEFQVRKFGLKYEDPSLFVKPQCFSPKLYIPWTVVWSLYYISNLIAEIIYDEHLGGRYFTRVTHVALLLQSVFIFTDCIVTIYVHIRRPDILGGSVAGLTWYIKMQWFLFNATNSFSVLISLIYYTLLDVTFSHGSIYAHLTNSLYTILGILFSAKPVQLLHVYQPMIPAILYMLFSTIYHLCGGAPIYPILDWGEKTGQTALTAVITIFVAIPVIHLCCYLLYCLRVFVSRKCKCNGKEYIFKETKVKI